MRTPSKFSKVLAPYYAGRVQMRSAEGWTWWQPGQAPEPGWFWWDEAGSCLGPADPVDLWQFPLSLVQKLEPELAALGKQRVPLRLANPWLIHDWLKAWWDGTAAWAVEPASGPTAPRLKGPPPVDKVRLAVERGGGILLEAAPETNGWRVRWSRSGVEYATLVDPGLNVLSAGFCLSGQERIQDLTSLVSLVEGRESQDADPTVWRRHAGW